MPLNVTSAHSHHGGENEAHKRVKHLVTSGNMTTYKDTRNGTIGPDFSTKLSSWLALGCITARQIHQYLMEFEDGLTELGKGTHGYSKGENKGTAAVRFELLWRDYMRLCTRKFGPRLFRVEGFRNDRSTSWRYLQKDPQTQKDVERFLEGRTGNGFIDASMRELYLTGYTSNRLRQNVASFLAKHMGVDWRIGAEWYEYLLVDYDLSSNWGNWQYNAGVGNDPREARMFNPVKQAFDYDANGEYVKMWVEQLRDIDDPQVLFQPWKMDEGMKASKGLKGDEWVEEPLKRINYGGGRNRGGQRGNHGGGGGGGGRGQGGRGGRHGKGRGGRNFRREGMLDKGGNA